MKAGTIILFSTGEYSDYGIRDEARAMKDFNLDEEREAFTAAQHDDDDCDVFQKFGEWLRARGCVADLTAGEVVEVHLGDYGHFELPLEPES